MKIYKFWLRFHWSFSQWTIPMITSSNGNIFRVTSHLCVVFTGHRWIPHTKASDTKLWYIYFLGSAWTNTWANNGEAGELGRHRAHYDVIVRQFAINSSGAWEWGDYGKFHRSRAFHISSYSLWYFDNEINVTETILQIYLNNVIAKVNLISNQPFPMEMFNPSKCLWLSNNAVIFSLN